MNASARRYKVMLDNGLWMTVEARQKKVLRLEISALLQPLWPESVCKNRAMQKRILYFLLVKVTREINGMDPVPHAMYKSQEVVMNGLTLYDKAGMGALVIAHQDQLPGTGKQEDHLSSYYTLELEAKRNPHLYVAYHRHLWSRLSRIRDQMSQDDGPEAKLPSLFTIIPQLKPKARCIDIGTDQLVELLVRLSGQEDVADLPWGAVDPHKPQKKRTAVQWKQMVTAGKVWEALFRRIPRHFTGTLTTDGVRAHWHVGQSKAEKKAMVMRNRAIRAKNKAQTRIKAKSKSKSKSNSNSKHTTNKRKLSTMELDISKKLKKQKSKTNKETRRSNPTGETSACQY
jgi:hypothetical protein